MTASPAATDRSRCPRLSAVTSRRRSSPTAPACTASATASVLTSPSRTTTRTPPTALELVQGGDALRGDRVEDDEPDVHVPVGRGGLQVLQLAEHGPQARPRQRVAALHADPQPHPGCGLGVRGELDRRRRRPPHRRRRHPDSVPSRAQQPLHKNSTRPVGFPAGGWAGTMRTWGATWSTCLRRSPGLRSVTTAPDLRARVEAAQARLADPACRVVVCGEFKKGKSSLVNALLGARVCATDADVATAIPTYVRYGERLEAHVLDEESPGSSRGAAVGRGRARHGRHRARGAVGTRPRDPAPARAARRRPGAGGHARHQRRARVHARGHRAARPRRGGRARLRHRCGSGAGRRRDRVPHAGRRAVPGGRSARSPASTCTRSGAGSSRRTPSTCARPG